MKTEITKAERTKFTIFFNTREIWLIALLLGLAFGVRLYMVFHTYVICNDGVLYITISKLISQGKIGASLDVYFLNLYPFMIAAFQKVFSDWHFSAQMVSAVFGSLAIIPLYFLIRSWFDRDVTLISSILFIFHPYLVRFSAEVIRGPTFWFFCMMAIWVGWEAISRKKVWLFVLTSLLGAISLLLRTEGIFIVPLVAVWILLKDWRTFKSTYKQRIFFVLILVFTVPILLSPAILYLKAKTNHWHWSKANTFLAVATTNIGMDEIKKDFRKLELKPWKDSSQGSLEFVRLKEFLSLAIENRVGVVILEIIIKFIKAMHPLLIFLLLFGAVARKNIQYRKEELFLFSAVVLVLLLILRYTTVVFPYVATRFMMVPVMLSLLWAGIGIAEVEQRIRNASLTLHLARVNFIGFRYLKWALLVLIVFTLLPKALASQRAEKIPMKEAGIWIKEHGPKNPVIIGQRQLIWRVAFYANGTSIEMPSDHDLLKYAKEKRVNFLVVNEKKIDNSHLDLNRSFNPDYFKEEVEIGNPSGSYLIKIYSFKN